MFLSIALNKQIAASICQPLNYFELLSDSLIILDVCKVVGTVSLDPVSQKQNKKKYKYNCS